MMRTVGPVLTVVLAIVVLWYLGAAWLNATWVLDQAARAGESPSLAQVLRETMVQDRPKLPAPHQVLAGVWDGVAGQAVTSKRSLVWHGWVTLAPTLLGFGIGALAGLFLAIGIVHQRAMDMSVMPWAIASQTVPVVALAPIVIVLLAAVGVKGLVPKALIAAYLSFFPVLVGMVKGLRAPDAMQLDLLKTYSAPGASVLWKLRLPSAMPYLFASLKVAVASALVGTIVAELPAGSTAGLGARLLQGSYYGQTIQIWSALIATAILAAALVMVVSTIERIVLKRMGIAR